MKIIPVIDIIRGKAVLGRGGVRDEYKPVRSALTESSGPVDVAGAFRRSLGLNEVYIADIDMIEGRGSNLSIIREIRKKTRVNVILDPGIKFPEDISDELAVSADVIVLGTETLGSLDTAKEAVRILGPRRVTASIDLKKGELLSGIRELEDPEKAIEIFSGKFGIRKFILLDLNYVGSMKGPSERLCGIIRGFKNSGLCFSAGGGVKRAEDILKLKEAGAAAALVASALHSGKINRKDIRLLSEKSDL